MQFLEKNIKIVSCKHILIAEQALFSAFASKPGEQIHCEGEAFVSHFESVIKASQSVLTVHEDPIAERNRL